MLRLAAMVTMHLDYILAHTMKANGGDIDIVVLFYQTKNKVIQVWYNMRANKWLEKSYF